MAKKTKAYLGLSCSRAGRVIVLRRDLERGALAFGIGSRALAAQAQTQPQFIAAVTHAVGGSLIPVPGGVLIRGADKAILGAVGITRDVSDNDEKAALAGIDAAGLAADPG